MTVWIYIIQNVFIHEDMGSVTAIQIFCRSIGQSVSVTVWSARMHIGFN